ACPRHTTLPRGGTNFMRMRTAAAGLISLSTAAAMTLLAVSGTQATAAPVPGAAYDANAHADIVELDVELFGDLIPSIDEDASLLGVTVGHTSALADTEGAPRRKAVGETANLELDLLTANLHPERLETVAPPGESD